MGGEGSKSRVRVVFAGIVVATVLVAGIALYMMESGKNEAAPVSQTETPGVTVSSKETTIISTTKQSSPTPSTSFCEASWARPGFAVITSLGDVYVVLDVSGETAKILKGSSYIITSILPPDEFTEPGLMFSPRILDYLKNESIALHFASQASLVTARLDEGIGPMIARGPCAESARRVFSTGLSGGLVEITKEMKYAGKAVPSAGMAPQDWPYKGVPLDYWTTTVVNPEGVEVTIRVYLDVENGLGVAVEAETGGIAQTMILVNGFTILPEDIVSQMLSSAATT